MKKYLISEIGNTPLGGRITPFTDFLKENDLSSLPAGKYPLDGGCSLSVFEITTKAEEKWEAHRKFIDIQYVISGAERMGYGDINGMTVKEEYNSDKDVLFLDGSGGSYIDVLPGEFVIFGIRDAHAPGLISGGKPATVKKAVIKIPADL